MHRIEQYAKDLSAWGFLREYTGALPRGLRHVVCVAEEIADMNGEPTISRSWFIAVPPDAGYSIHDGREPPDLPPHKIVSRDLSPGAPSKPYDSSVPITGRPDITQLLNLQKARDEHSYHRELHRKYCDEWHQHLATIDQQATQIKQLEAHLQVADRNTRELSERAADLDSRLQQSRAELEALREAKSFWRQLRCKLTQRK